MATDENICFGKHELLSKLEEWNIQAETIEHPEVFTVETALPYVEHLDGIFAKNLFLKDKKKRLYLFCAPHNVEITLNDLAKKTGASGGLRFADESLLKEKLGLTQGSVSLFGIINDHKKDVKLLLHEQLCDDTYSKIHFHPMVNSASTAISPKDLKIFLEKTQHEPLIIKTVSE